MLKQILKIFRLTNFNVEKYIFLLVTNISKNSSQQISNKKTGHLLRDSSSSLIIGVDYVKKCFLFLI